MDNHGLVNVPHFRNLLIFMTFRIKLLGTHFWQENAFYHFNCHAYYQDLHVLLLHQG